MVRHPSIYAAAIVAAIGLSSSVSLAQIRQAVPEAPATRPASDPAEIPVKQVVLFSSGVGYFEHRGKVTGDVTTELRFKTDQVNDILKSLLLQDIDGGTVGTVSYAGLAPLAHTLKSFQVDITANPDMADLLNQLRGAKITVTQVVGPQEEKVSGVILGVEKKQQAFADKPVVETVKLNLKVGRQFRSYDLDSITSMELDDPALQKELDDALAALVKSRDQDKKPMTLHFNGKGERRVRIGYLVETPIWKTSYRLVFDQPSGDHKNPQPEPAPATLPANPATAPATAPAEPVGPPAKLQGWAIVENQTDNDWTDVQLALVSGRPLSFIQDLYHSQYLPRPIVQADNYASLRPQTYAGGIYDIKDLVTNIPNFTDAPDFSMNSSNNQAQNPQGGGAIGPGGGGGGGGQGLFSAGSSKMAEKNAAANNQQQAPIDPTASIISAASASRVGELFKYKIPNVSLARQSSAMIPIVTDDIDAQRISIYNAAVLPDHPLLGALVKNNTGKYLLQGPITVLDHGSYAGDARIEDLPPGQQRLISFGIDQQLEVQTADLKQDSASLTAKVVKGIITLTSRSVVQQTYVADNKSDETRILVIEHPRMPEFKLITPVKAEEATPELLRFRRSIQPHQIAKLPIVQEHVFDTSTAILPLKSADLGVYLKDGAIPQTVRDALVKAAVMKDDVVTLQNQLADTRQQLELLSADQGRIRDNLKAVAAESDYYKRLMKKIDEQESDIEKLQKTAADILAKAAASQKQLEAYVNGLTVG